MSKVSDRWQITIDRKARKQLGVKPGMIPYQRVVDGHLEVIFLPGPHNESLFGVFPAAGKQRPPITNREIEEAVMEAIADKLEQERESSDAGN